MAAAPEAKPKESPSQKESESFVMNMFKGVVQPAQLFPYPDPLTDEQRDTVSMLIDPVEKFFQVIYYLEKLHKMVGEIIKINLNSRKLITQIRMT